MPRLNHVFYLLSTCYAGIRDTGPAQAELDSGSGKVMSVGEIGFGDRNGSVVLLELC